MASAALFTGLHAETVPEPSTTIYGKVMHRSFGNEHQLVEGALVWTLKDENGQHYTYAAELEDIGGVYSYRVSIPHQVLSSGLTVDSGTIPLGASASRYDFESITLDGFKTDILWSQTDFLKLLQNSRAATHRIDLEVSFDLTDTDGDGIADWWEKKYGLDWQVADSDQDGDLDGLTNLMEYLAGSDPLVDNRVPEIQTKRLAAYGESINGVWLRTVDTDTAAEDLTFTLGSLPDGGTFYLKDSTLDSEADALEIGATFTQQQVNDGLLIFSHNDSAVTETSFNLSLSDGDHIAASAEIEINVFPPSEALLELVAPNAAPSWWRDQNNVFEAYWGLRENVLSGDLVESVLLYLLGKDYAWTLWDQRAETLALDLAVKGSGSHFIIGGSGDDILSGSSQDDILNGGEGEDRLTGGSGLDLFIVTDMGLEVLADFNVAQDVLDLSGLPATSSGVLNDYLQVTNDGTNSLIGVDSNADGSGYSDATIKLEGVALTQNDLHLLWSQGQLLLGDVEGLSSVSIASVSAVEVEEGYSSSDIVLLRQGPLDEPLTVSLAYLGNATNDADYKLLPSELTFAVGESKQMLKLEPRLDETNEYSESVNIRLQSSAIYVLGSQHSVELDIIDAKQRFSIAAVDQAAVVNEDPAYLLISRQGPRSGMIQLLLRTGGSAIAGTDYSAINKLVSFGDGQPSMLIPVQALAGGSLANKETSKTLELSIRAALDASYLLGDSPSATVRLLSESQDLDSWAAEELPTLDTTDVGVVLADTISPRTGLNALLEYASSFGLDLEDGVSSEERVALSPKLMRKADGAYIEFSKRLNDPSLQYIVEYSTDLKSWNNGAEHFEAIELPDEKVNAGIVCYRLIGSEDGTNAYFRVRVELDSGN